VRCHDTNDTASSSIKASRNDTENNIFAGENASNLRLRARSCARRVGALHDADSGGPALLHQPGRLSDGGLGAHCGRLGTGIHDGGEVGKSSLLSQLLGPCKHGSCLGVRTHTSQFGLDTSHRTEELLRCKGATLHLAERLMEDLGDIEETDDVTILIADGLRKV